MGEATEPGALETGTWECEQGINFYYKGYLLQAPRDTQAPPSSVLMTLSLPFTTDWVLLHIRDRTCVLIDLPLENGILGSLELPLDPIFSTSCIIFS